MKAEKFEVEVRYNRVNEHAHTDYDFYCLEVAIEEYNNQVSECEVKFENMEYSDYRVILWAELDDGDFVELQRYSQA